jgi:XRE family transcriptional regulator of biofilm formation
MATEPLGIRVQRLRRERGWSLGDLAERAQVPTTLLAGLEAGATISRAMELAEKVAAAFQISVMELLDDVPPAEPPAPGQSDSRERPARSSSGDGAP